MRHDATQPSAAAPIEGQNQTSAGLETDRTVQAAEREPSVEPVCARCGSAELVRDARATWSVSEQCWELAGTYDSTTCQDCGAESDELAAWRPASPDMMAAVHVPPSLAWMIYHPGTGTLIALEEAVLLQLDDTADGDVDAEDVAAALHAQERSAPLRLLDGSLASR